MIWSAIVSPGQPLNLELQGEVARNYRSPATPGE